MKRLKMALALLCALMLLLSMTVPAFAGDDPLNQIKGSGSKGGSSGGRPSAADILATEGGDKIQLPKSSSYYSGYVISYINTKAQNSVYVHKQPGTVQGEKTLPFAFHGSRVTVLAEESGLSCILYHDMDNVLRAGWVYSDYISASYPGQTVYIRNSNAGVSPWLAGDLEVQWSKEPFVGTRQKYTILKSPVKEICRFTLDYQVIARNGAETNEVLGPRTLYVNAGDGWVEVGSFDYDKLGAIHVEVTLEKPMTLAAVATVASCGKPDAFSFRQSVLDVYQAD